MTDLTPRERVSYAIRMIVSHALYYAGALHVIRRFALRKKAVVLMYHRVLTPEQRRRTASPPGIVVDDATFARHLAILKRHFTILTLEEFEERLLNNRPFEDASCLITFDDGWIDNFENALPILRAQRVPAVIFLAVNFIGQRRVFTREALTHLIVKALEQCRNDPARAASFRELLAPLGLDGALDIADERPLHKVKSLIESHRYASGPRYEAAVTSLSRQLGLEAAELTDLDTFVDWQQVDEMRRAGVAFGGHGADHRVLDQVSPEVVRSEVETSSTLILDRLGVAPTSFAYPGGGWNGEVADTVKHNGYQLAFTIEPGYVSAHDDRYAVRRMNIHEGMTASAAMFMARLTGVF
jgi:peptidoglycan/xylan/chitin deacetylase (PgdA/CDA1 family)